MMSCRKGIYFLSFIAATATAYAQVGDFTNTADWPVVGTNKAAGSASFSGGVYTLEGNGNDIWGNADEGLFVYSEISGNASISGKVNWIDHGTNDWAKIGVMVRSDGDDPASTHYWAMLRGAANGDQSGPQWRPQAGGASSGFDFRDDAGALVPNPGDGLYLRVTHVADINVLISEWSNDGSTWNFGHSLALDLGDTCAFGLAITNHEDNTALAVGEVSDVQISQTVPVTALRTISGDPVYTAGIPISVSIAAGGGSGAITLTETPPAGWVVSDISNGGTVSGGTITWNLSGATTVSYTVTPSAGSTGDGVFSGSAGGSDTLGADTITAPDPVGDFDHHLDIGPVGGAGSADYDGDIYYVSGSGADIWGNADEFHYVYKQVSGAFEISGIVFGYNDTGANEWSKIGFMVRDNLTAGSAHLFGLVRGSDLQYETQFRPSQASASQGTGLKANQIGDIRLVRSGNTVESYYIDSNTGEWVLDTVQTIQLTDPVYVGMAVTSHENPNYAVGEYEEVQITLRPFQVLKSLSQTTVTPGGSIDVTVTAEIREGESHNFTITETYSAGVSVSGISASAGDATDDGNGTVTWTASGATGNVTLTYTLNVDANVTEAFINVGGTYDDGADYSGSTGDTSIPVEALTDLGIFMGHEDIGATGATGNVSFDGETWRVIGSGADIWGTGDQFHYLWLRAEGDFRFSIDEPYIGGFGSNPSTNDWQKVGIMVRQDLTPGSAYAFGMLRSSDQALMLQWRDSNGIDAAWTDGSQFGADIWNDNYDPASAGINNPSLDEVALGGSVVMLREGNIFSLWYVYNGVEEYQFEHETVMTDPIYVGVGVTSHQGGALSQGIFKNPQFEGNTVSVSGWMLY